MICWWCRWQISRAADERRPLAEPVRRHADGCAGCAAHWKAALVLRSAMAPLPCPPDLHGRIMRAVRGAQAVAQEPAGWRRGVPASLWAAAAAALLAVVAVGVWFHSRWPSGRSGAEPAAWVSGFRWGAVEERAERLVRAALEAERHGLREDLLTTGRGLLAALDISFSDIRPGSATSSNGAL